jgi:hypothetical protein
MMPKEGSLKFAHATHYACTILRSVKHMARKISVDFYLHITKERVWIYDNITSMIWNNWDNVEIQLDSRIDYVGFVND